MKLLVRGLVTAALCIALAVGVVFWLSRPKTTRGHAPGAADANGSDARAGAGKPASLEPTVLETFPDPNAPGTVSRVYTDYQEFDLGVYTTATSFTGSLGDARSLADVRKAIQGRTQRGRAEWRAKADRLVLDSPPTAQQARAAIEAWRSLAFLDMYDGKFADATRWLERAQPLCRIDGVPDSDDASIRALLGIVALRRGEVENCLECLGPSSCILPIAREAVHTNPAGSREAVRQFTDYLARWPGDLRIRWLLNLAHMTLGEYPAKVPRAYLIPLDGFRSTAKAPRFGNVAPLVGINARGPGLAGGSVFDDFNGDGLPDLFTSSIGVERGPSLFINRGDGTFDDRSDSAGLDDQVYALNVMRADYDNDGALDLLPLRGGWERPARLSLLRNRGDGTFEDVTVRAGMAEPIASESAAWGDFDNDGFVDVFVCGEYPPDPSVRPDPRNRCRLYKNRGDGTFVDVAARAGVTNERFAKGAVWGDYDNDGRLDLFVSNLSKRTPLPSRLYHNEGDGTFRDVTAQVGIADESGIINPPSSFPCLFWDFDNDGHLDLFINDYKVSLAEVIASYLGLPVSTSGPPRLYRNLGDGTFRNVSREVGLARPIAAMSVNCGDIDNDGFLDLYCGTGWMTYAGLVPNVMLKNQGGQRFDDVTEATGTGHLQKGHGAAFADYDGDGDADLFIGLGGGYPGDKGYSALFRNSGSNRHWLKVKLIGTKTNRAALGARVRADIETTSSQRRSVYRMIGTNGSFGGNTLVETIGLGDATAVKTLTITWPTSGTTQTFRDVAADRSLEITEGADDYKVLPPPTPSASKS